MSMFFTTLFEISINRLQLTAQFAYMYAFQIHYGLFILDLRQISTTFAMPVVQNVEDSHPRRFPLIIRKGRNSLSMMCSHKDNVKKFFTTCNDAFLSNLQSQTLTRPTILVCVLYEYAFGCVWFCVALVLYTFLI